MSLGLQRMGIWLRPVLPKLALHNAAVIVGRRLPVDEIDRPMAIPTRLRWSVKARLGRSWQVVAARHCAAFDRARIKIQLAAEARIPARRQFVPAGI